MITSNDNINLIADGLNLLTENQIRSFTHDELIDRMLWIQGWVNRIREKDNLLNGEHNVQKTP